MCDLLDKLKSKSKYSSISLGLFIAMANFGFRTILIEFSYLLNPPTFTDE